jgi:hypothetical protein
MGTYKTGVVRKSPGLAGTWETCIICGKKFYVKPRQKGKKICGLGCLAEWHRNPARYYRNLSKGGTK